MANFTVLYDANVLYPAVLRDLLMRLALTDLYRAKWSDDIHEEWMRSLLGETAVLEAVRRQLVGYTRPPLAVEELATRLRTSGLAELATHIESRKSILR